MFLKFRSALVERIFFIFCSMAAIKETSKKLVSISKWKMSYVLLAKVVDFVGVLLKYKKGKRCNTSPLKTCLKFLCEKVSRKGLWTNLHCISQDLGLSVIKTPEYSSRVCTKCALKIRNAVELCCFVKDTLNPQPVPVEEDIIDENSDPYQYRSKRMSKSPSNSILKGTSSEELSAYLNRFVLQEVKVTCPFCNAIHLELKFDALFADLSSILSSGMN